MPPETLEVVVGTRARLEYVHDEVAIVLENPFGILVALDADRHLAAIFQFEVDLVADGLVLAAAGACTNQKEIGEGGDLSKIEDDDVVGFLGLSGSNCTKPIIFKDFLRVVLLAVAWGLLG
jgi:hypothetical protein